MASLHVVRFMADKALGLKLSPVTRWKLELLETRASQLKLANQLNADKLRKFELQLAEMDAVARCRALIKNSWAGDFSQYTDDCDGYRYSGYGPGAEGFGYDDPTTVAWMTPHPDAPCIWWRYHDPIGEGRVMTWLNRAADDIEDNVIPSEEYVYPKDTPELRELDIPEEVMPGQIAGRGARARFRRSGSY